MNCIAYLDTPINLKLFTNKNKLQNMHDVGKSNVIQFEKIISSVDNFTQKFSKILEGF